MISKHKGILVTGSHRSGTTWVGRMLSLPEDVIYIQEPFNLETSTVTLNFRFKHWFPHIPDIRDRGPLYQAIRRTLEFRHLPPAPGHLGPFRALKRRIRHRLENFDHRWHGRRPLIKDPLALFSAEDLAERFDLDVVCMVRHPLAFCSSLKKWNWCFPFSHLLEQPRLIERHFSEEAEEIREFAEDPKPIVRQAALLWNLFHKVIRRYQETHPHWHFERHAEMVADPVNRFETLYRGLDLDFTDAVAKRLQDSLKAKSGETGSTIYKARDADTVAHTWKHRLKEDEILHILKKTRDLRIHFYPEETDRSQLARCDAVWGWPALSA